jgi:hypothetical protein
MTTAAEIQQILSYCRHRISKITKQRTFPAAKMSTDTARQWLNRQLWPRCSARVGNPVANRHKWRHWPWKCGDTANISATCRRTVKFRIKFSNFLNWTTVSLFASNNSWNWVTKMHMFWKNLLKQCYFNNFFQFSIEQPNFLVFTWCGEFGDRVVHPACRETVWGQPDSKESKGV